MTTQTVAPVIDSANAMFWSDENKYFIEDSGEILFAKPYAIPVVKPKQIMAIGKRTHGGAFQVQTARPEIVFVLDEGLAMDADLMALRSNEMEPVQTLTEEQLDEIENEHIGHDVDF